MSLPLPGTRSTCSTKRASGAIPALGSTTTDVTHLTSLTLVSPMGVLSQPVSERFMADTFGIQSPTSLYHRIYALWPADSQWASAANVTEDFPVAPNDLLVFADGTTRLVRGVRPWRGQYMELFVEVAQP